MLSRKNTSYFHSLLCNAHRAEQKMANLHCSGQTGNYQFTPHECHRP